MTFGWLAGTGWCGRGGLAAGLGFACVLAFPSQASAGHCEYCNSGLPARVDIEPSSLPPDGVLLVLLIDQRDRKLDPEWWDAVSIEVLDANEATVPGGLEVLDGVTPGVWRPDTPWTEGEYSVSVSVDLGGDCGVPQHVFSVSVDATVQPAPMPSVEITSDYVPEVRGTIENLVCCDGASPYEASVPGILCPGYPSTSIDYSGGYCTWIEADGRLRVSAALDENEVSRFSIRERTTGARPTTTSGRMQLQLSAAACLEFEVVDLVSGARESTEACVEEQPSMPLGLHTRPEIEAELADACDGPGYVCDPGSWSSLAGCALWPDGGAPPSPPAEEDTDGPAQEAHEGGCSVTHPQSAWLMLLVILGLRCRRRSW